MKNQTPIEWLFEQLTQVERNLINKTFLQNNNTISGYQLRDLFQQAKEMEKTSMCSFTTGYVNNCVEIDHNEIELTKEVEEYYDWLESTKCQCDEGFCETQDNCKGLYSKI